MPVRGVRTLSVEKGYLQVSTFIAFDGQVGKLLPYQILSQVVQQDDSIFSSAVN